MIHNLSSYNWSKYSILIVEDDECSSFYLKEVLKSTQAKVLHAPGGKECIEMCRNTPSISLVLMDLKMPGVSGYEATRTIKQFRPELPVIAQTANSIYDSRIQCIEAGCDDFISKPIDSAELLDKISAFFK
jgi:CheY-like chemotaxis protein